MTVVIEQHLSQAAPDYTNWQTINSALHEAFTADEDYKHQVNTPTVLTGFETTVSKLPHTTWGLMLMKPKLNSSPNELV